MPPAAVLVHDWSSTDETVVIANRFAQACSGQFAVRIHRHATTPGAASSFMQAIEASLNDETFDYLLLCDQDDVWSPSKLTEYERRLRAVSTPADILFSDVRLVAADGTQIAPAYYAGLTPFRRPEDLQDPSILLANPVIGMTLCVSRRCLEALRPRMAGPWLMHDWAIVLLALSQGFRTQYVDMPLVDYRQHSTNTLGASTGLRLTSRIKKARKQFKRLRVQIAWLAASTEAEWSPQFVRILRGGLTQRFLVAEAAFRSRLLRRPAAMLLGCAAILFW